MKVAHELRQHPDFAAKERCVRCGEVIKVSGPPFQDGDGLIVVHDLEAGSWEHVTMRPDGSRFCDE